MTPYNVVWNIYSSNPICKMLYVCVCRIEMVNNAPTTAYDMLSNNMKS